MPGLTELDDLLQSLSPVIQAGDYVFCTVEGELSDYVALQPLSSFAETEGLTLILPLNTAQQAGLSYNTVFKQISLQVHSSLDAVGLTAAVAAQLTHYDISANVVAAYYHDHIFVPSDKAELALEALQALSQA